MGHQSYVLLCSKMTSFPPSEGVSEITFDSICSRSLWTSQSSKIYQGPALHILRIIIIYNIPLSIDRDFLHWLTHLWLGWPTSNHNDLLGKFFLFHSHSFFNRNFVKRVHRVFHTFGNNSCACGSDFDSIIDDPLNTNENSKTHFDDFFGKCEWANGNVLARLVSPAKWQYECCEKIDSWYVTVAIWSFFSRNLYGKFSLIVLQQVFLVSIYNQ